MQPLDRAKARARTRVGVALALVVLQALPHAKWTRSIPEQYCTVSFAFAFAFPIFNDIAEMPFSEGLRTRAGAFELESV